LFISNQKLENENLPQMKIFTNQILSQRVQSGSTVEAAEKSLENEEPIPGASGNNIENNQGSLGKRSNS
jgi:hypothetical protein